MTDAELRGMLDGCGDYAQPVINDLLALRAAVRRERETAAAGPLDEHLAARAEVDRLVAGEKD